MNDPAKSLLVAQVATIILETFDVPPAPARHNAEWLVALAEGWGGSGVGPLDWNFQVRKWFGDELKWRSEEERQRFLAERQSSAGASETWVRDRPSPDARGETKLGNAEASW